jgi:16S rRNA (guanine527-N7)-methyltransferase
VKHDLSIKELIKFLNKHRICLNKNQVKQLESFKKALIGWNKKTNLISKGDTAYVVERHFLPAFYYVFQLIDDGILKDQRILDLGSGGGLPGILLSIYFHENEIVLLDSSRKKTLFLKYIVKRLNLHSTVVCDRAEDYKDNLSEKVDIITARSVAAIPILINLGMPLLNDKGRLYAMKGTNYKNEMNSVNLCQTSLIELPINTEWIDFSNYLTGKTLVRMEKISDKK